MTENIASLRIRAGLSQQRLAELSGVSQPNISAYESGRRTPRPETLERILRALRVRPSKVLEEHRDETVDLAKRHHLGNVRVFGSAARGEDTPDSDIDLLVDAEPGASLFDLAGFRLDMVDLLGIKVDVVASGSIGAAMDRILAEAVPL
ncbi:helix-turn-helix domain-containing protein [Sinomonas sp. ASV322]|uniref:helix-turn-helix domain-containing protein n=1 Tax=Sinomonas sp. ASV322 TaxID=3041920 RepID=UPI0027DC7731|nr:helix-turn-helix domain-containing protein [Sinomonas sp. ASV322]MDQ4502827.1 helix-turn-helix domain-containing protein [Sinomonas sp. ASV322]